MKKVIRFGGVNDAESEISEKVTARSYCNKGFNRWCVCLYKGYEEVKKILNQDCCNREKKPHCYNRRR